MTRRAKIVGTGSYLPPRVVTNEDLAEPLQVSPEGILRISGVQERRYAASGVYTSDLAVEAARMALSDAGLEAEEVDCIILATLSPDMLFPGTGVFLQEKLGIASKGCACHDVRSQCSGFLSAVELSKAFVESGAYRTILAVGAEVHSSLMEFAPRGRTVTVLFGDAASAVVFQARDVDREDDGVFYTEMHADGRGALKGIHQRGFDISCKPFLGYDVLDAEKNEGMWPQMTNARNLFKNAVLRMSEVALSALEKNGLTTDDVDWVLAHQANAHILRDVADRMKIPREKMLENIHKYGNTSAASVPLLLDENVRNGRIRRGELLVLAGFGSGFTWGAVLVRY